MSYSRVLYSFIWAIGICLFVSGVVGPIFGMDLGVAHYLLLAAISLYGLRKFVMWFNRPQDARGMVDCDGHWRPRINHHLIAHLKIHFGPTYVGLFYCAKVV